MYWCLALLFSDVQFLCNLFLSLSMFSADLKVAMNSGEDALLETMKRPFCNAFTGCGKKRLSEESSSVDDLVRLSQRIMGEAQAWENLQRTFHSAREAFRKRKWCTLWEKKGKPYLNEIRSTSNLLDVIHKTSSVSHDHSRFGSRWWWRRENEEKQDYLLNEISEKMKSLLSFKL